MTELRRVDAPLSVWDEARAEITRMEKAHPEGENIVIVLSDPEGIEFSSTGPALRPSAVAGLLFMAAQTVCE